MRASTLRSWRLATLLGLAAALAACATRPNPSDPRVRAALLREFREGRVHLDCGSCRFDFRSAEWMLRDGRHEDLVIAILEVGDGSGRSWYLLGRAAEATGSPQLALLYYTRSLSSPRSPIVPLWPIYEDVTYRIRELARAPAAAASTSAPAAKAVEYVTEDAIIMKTRPGQVGAFLAKLERGDALEVLDRSGDWEQVRLADGRAGWVWSRYTSPRPPAASSKPAQASASAKAPAPGKPAPAKQPAAPAKQPAAPAVAAAKPSAPPKPSAASASASATPKSSAPNASAPPKPSATPKATAAAKPAKDAPAKPAVAKTPPPAEPPRPLVARAGGLGIFGSPLPAGAKLAGQSHGAAGSDDHPTETYEISAGAGDIVGFYEREMERAGWRKSFISSEFLLYFEKDDRTLCVLIERDGGTFTLLGS